MICRPPRRQLPPGLPRCGRHWCANSGTRIFSSGATFPTPHSHTGNWILPIRPLLNPEGSFDKQGVDTSRTVRHDVNAVDVPLPRTSRTFTNPQWPAPPLGVFPSGPPKYPGIRSKPTENPQKTGRELAEDGQKTTLNLPVISQGAGAIRLWLTLACLMKTTFGDSVPDTFCPDNHEW